MPDISKTQVMLAKSAASFEPVLGNLPKLENQPTGVVHRESSGEAGSELGRAEFAVADLTQAHRSAITLVLCVGSARETLYPRRSRITEASRGDLASNHYFYHPRMIGILIVAYRAGHSGISGDVTEKFFTRARG